MTNRTSITASLVFLSLCSLLMAGNVDLKGAVPGKWTMDIDAANTLAAKQGLPILINFSGSDWCGWCKLMDKNVFSEKEWQDYAKENLVMVLIDFPKDKSIVPKEYVDRNDTLKEKHGVEGFPTFILLDSDAATELGRLGAAKDKTPAKFIQDITMSSRYRAGEVARYSKTLPADKRAAYQKLVDGIAANSKTITDKKKQMSEAYVAIAKAEEKIDELKSQAAAFRAAQMDGDQLKRYKALQSDMDKAKKELEDWLKSEPEQSEANMNKFKSMSGELQDIAAQLAEF